MSEKEEKLQCSFCGKDRDEVSKLIAGPSAYICNECVSISFDIITKPDAVDFEKKSASHFLTPSKIRRELDKFIIGQDEAKELLSVSAYNHYKRISSDENMHSIEKSNILLMGNTGTGKTLLATTLSKILDVPFAITDATALTEAGYAGEDVDGILERLISVADNDIEKAQKGIIFIDEIDKKAKRFDQAQAAKDISGEGVQQSLLRLMEGATIKVNISGKKYIDESVEFDTTNVLFIVGGAFVGIEDLIKKTVMNTSKIGFTANVEHSRNKLNILQYVQPEHVIKYGIIPELVGRLPIITTLEDLDVPQMIQVMTSVENNYIDQVKRLLAYDGIELTFSDEYLTTAAELASKEKVGVRALKSVIDRSLINVMYRAPELKKKGVLAVEFDKYPSKYNKPKLIFKDKEVRDRAYKLYRGKDAK